MAWLEKERGLWWKGNTEKSTDSSTNKVFREMEIIAKIISQNW